MADRKYFDKHIGGSTFYVDGDLMSSIRFCVMLFGEDPALVLDAFWKERCRDGEFIAIPLTAHGLPPRPALCSRTSLREALRTAKIQPNSADEKGWRKACEAHDVPFGGRPGAPGWKQPEKLERANRLVTNATTR
jgi:hypothetical protein